MLFLFHLYMHFCQKKCFALLLAKPKHWKFTSHIIHTDIFQGTLKRWRTCTEAVDYPTAPCPAAPTERRPNWSRDEQFETNNLDAYSCLSLRRWRWQSPSWRLHRWASCFLQSADPSDSGSGSVSSRFTKLSNDNRARCVPGNWDSLQSSRCSGRQGQN